MTDPTFAVGDRVTTDDMTGTVVALTDDVGYVWILIDDQAEPVTAAVGDVSLVPPPVFEVGHNYKIPGVTDATYHVVYKIDDNNFVAYISFDNGGISSTLLIPLQRALVDEV